MKGLKKQKNIFWSIYFNYPEILNCYITICIQDPRNYCTIIHKYASNERLDQLFKCIFFILCNITISKMYRFIVSVEDLIYWKQVNSEQQLYVCLWNTLSFYVTALFRRYESAEHDHSRPARVHEWRWHHYLCLIRWFMTNEIYNTFDQCLSAKLHVSLEFVVVVFSIAAKLVAWVESQCLSHELIIWY